jgi:hypothetical protein
VSDSEFDALLDEDAPVGEQIDAAVEARASEPLEEEVPPEPELAEIVPLAERERRKLAAMTPEQKERYDAASAEIMSHPAVIAFSETEELHRKHTANFKAAFLASRKKKA